MGTVKAQEGQFGTEKQVSSQKLNARLVQRSDGWELIPYQHNPMSLVRVKDSSKESGNRRHFP
jgi:hypothetical protein